MNTVEKNVKCPLPPPPGYIQKIFYGDRLYTIGECVIVLAGGVLLVTTVVSGEMITISGGGFAWITMSLRIFSSYISKNK